jgi:hypothetical protein
MSEKLTDTRQFNNAMEQHRAQMDRRAATGIGSTNLNHAVVKLNENTLPEAHGQPTVITGEQPYGPFGTSKVIGKRLLAHALQVTNSEIYTVELFANHDLVGSEEGFYRLATPTNGRPEGVVLENILSSRYRSNRETASGIILPHEYITPFSQKLTNGLRSHYPGNKSGLKEPRFNMEVISDWIGLYGAVNEITPAENYAEAHIKWLTDLERSIGLQMDHVTREGEIDLRIAQNGGIEIMQELWVDGLKKLEASGYTPTALRIGEEEHKKTPFNLAINGRRLDTTYGNSDQSQVIVSSREGQQTITLDEALSGKYDFSWKAVPRVVLYSLSGISGHITGGGSIYNTDAAAFLDQFDIPYFPIASMNPKLNGEKASVLQYATISSGRKNDKALEAVRSGQTSLLDFVLSCDPEVAREAIQKTIEQSNPFNINQTVTIPNREGELPK